MYSDRLRVVLSDGCSFTAGLATALVQVVLMRELFGVLEGHEVSVALSLAVWVVGIACGADEVLVTGGAQQAEDRPGWRTWTDDYSNLIQILR